MTQTTIELTEEILDDYELHQDILYDELRENHQKEITLGDYHESKGIHSIQEEKEYNDFLKGLDTPENIF